MLCLSVAKRVVLMAGLLVGLSSPAWSQAAPRLSDLLSRQALGDLALDWQQGAEARGPVTRLVVRDGSVQLARCTPACQPLGTAQPLKPGEQAQLLSRLRITDFSDLGPLESREQADRTLDLRVGSTTLGQWPLPRAAWPTAPDGDSLADLLDDWVHTLEARSHERGAVPIPDSPAALRALRLQLRVAPTRLPGGLLVLEEGRLQRTPAEGTLPRTPPLARSERPLTDAEEQQLLTLLRAAQLDGVESRVPKREQPAIGDDDGRLVTLHLLPRATAGAASGQPRGIARYLADLQRSSAAPLVHYLLGLLLEAPPVVPAPPVRKPARVRSSPATRAPQAGF